MENRHTYKQSEVDFDHSQRLIILVMRILGPLFLMTAGLFMLYLRIPGWSLILGLPMTTVGMVFLIYSYDEILNKNLHHHHGEDSNEDIDY